MKQKFYTYKRTKMGLWPFIDMQYCHFHVAEHILLTNAKVISVEPISEKCKISQI